MKKYLLDLLKGILIGMAIPIPGFNAGAMAVVLNIYEPFVNSFSNLLSKPLATLKDIWAMLIGMLIGVVGSIWALVWLLSNAPIPTALFFVGLVLGSLPRTFKNANRSKIRVIDIVLFLAGVALVVGMPFINSGAVQEYHFDFPTAILIFLLSMIAATANVVPGVSGSMILLALGYYEIIWVSVVGAFFVALTSFDFPLILKTIVPVIPFGLGVILGMVLVSKFIAWLLKKAPQAFYYAILGLLGASPFAIIFSVYLEYGAAFLASGWLSWVIGIFTMAFGIFGVVTLQKYEKRKDNVTDN